MDVLELGGSTMWDVFICHASEDKEDVARPLAKDLSEAGLKVWYDEFSLTIGDSLRRSIDEGLTKSSYGVVILSPAFFSKNWPQHELDGLVSREMGGEPKVILPVWHKVTEKEVIQYSPTLVGKVAAKTTDGLEVVVRKILEVVKPTSTWASAAKEPLPLPKQTGTAYIATEYGTSMHPTFDLEALSKLHPLLGDAVSDVGLSSEARVEMVQQAYAEQGWPSSEFPYSVANFCARYYIPMVRPVIVSHEDNSHNDLRGVGE